MDGLREARTPLTDLPYLSTPSLFDMIYVAYAMPTNQLIQHHDTQMGRKQGGRNNVLFEYKV